MQQLEDRSGASGLIGRHNQDGGKEKLAGVVIQRWLASCWDQKPCVIRRASGSGSRRSAQLVKIRSHEPNVGSRRGHDHRLALKGLRAEDE